MLNANLAINSQFADKTKEKWSLANMIMRGEGGNGAIIIRVKKSISEDWS